MKTRYGVIMLVLLFLLTGCNVDKLTQPVDPNDTSEVLFTVPKGASTKRIASLLKENHLILSEYGFTKRSEELKAAGQMKAGDYMLSPSMSADTIIEKLQSGSVYVETVKVTIPEGFELDQIVDRLVNEGLGERQAFLDALSDSYNYAFLEGLEINETYLEGFIFPATYEFKKGLSEKKIIDQMLSTFNHIFKDDYYMRAYEMDMSILEIVTLASIIEREAKLDEERALISSVFHNRLVKGRLLQSCATVQYALGERKQRLLNADLEIESPYNTYKYKGLPPGPIASPGEKSLIAALYPEESDYLYFRTTQKNDGSHHFSKTFEEHVAAGGK